MWPSRDRALLTARGWWATTQWVVAGSDVARLVRDWVSAVRVGWWCGLDVDWGAGEAACVCVSEVMLRLERSCSRKLYRRNVHVAFWRVFASGMLRRPAASARPRRCWRLCVRYIVCARACAE